MSHIAPPSGTDGYDGPETVDETTRLLPGPAGDEESVSPARQRPTPIPKAQLSALFAVRIVDPIAYQQIFPYINQLLADLRIAEPERVGFYSGLVESIYSLAQVFSMYQLGKISDVVGRRPVVFTGLVGIAVTTTTFGLSKSLIGIVASRFFGGLVAANEAVIHSILAEITDDTNQDLAVSIYFLAWPIGTIIGPLIGGTLANATTRYPQYFSWNVFVEHPYLPPCIVSAACALVGAALGYTFIEETLSSKRQHVDSHISSSSGSQEETCSDDAKDSGMIELLSIPAMRALTISGFILSFLSLAFDVVFTLFCYTPIDAGGLALDPSSIGSALSSAGTVAVLLRFFAMPYILRHFDYVKTYSACMYIWAVAFGFLPFLNVLARTQSSNFDSLTVSTSSSSAFIWPGLLTLLALSKIAAIPHTLSMLLVKRHTPSPSLLGQSNGVVQFAMCGGRAVAPIVVNTLFTGVNGMEWVKRQRLGWGWAVAMVLVALAGARVTKEIRSGTRTR